MLDRVEKKAVRSSAIMQMLGQKQEEVEQEVKEEREVEREEEKEVEQIKDKNSRDRNPKAYERYRGVGGTKPMSYYLSDSLIKGIALKAAIENRDKSDIVREALTEFLQEELAEVERLEERGR